MKKIISFLPITLIVPTIAGVIGFAIFAFCIGSVTYDLIYPNDKANAKTKEDKIKSKITQFFISFIIYILFLIILFLMERWHENA